jgi:hypothetical protein
MTPFNCPSKSIYRYFFEVSLARPDGTYTVS